MTREKEIEQAMKESVAETIYASGWGMTPQATDLLECAFTKGAEWADTHPQFSKEEFIKKACEWLLNNAHLYVYATTKEKRALLFNYFKSAMEE